MQNNHSPQNELLHHNLIILSRSIAELESKIHILEKKLINTENRLKETSTSGWLPLKIAAQKFALTASALRQLLKRKHIPEDIVWRQSSSNSAIFVNTNLLPEYL